MRKPQSSNHLDFLMVGCWSYILACSVDLPNPVDVLQRKETVRVKKAKGGTEEVLHKASKSTKSTDVLQDDNTSRQLK